MTIALWLTFYATCTLSNPQEIVVFVKTNKMDNTDTVQGIHGVKSTSASDSSTNGEGLGSYPKRV